ncbi:alpha/beta hydrolase [Citromicrobium bathyomarinum]|uniref:alpha/beta hydrolase n=1 Tax=Citromicrobium bathyomarinum TaxID=72174 RepID=UPI001E5305D5|nr:alpha/beta fold hydrolase [Citromicrobium bathyomarinum]
MRRAITLATALMLSAVASPLFAKEAITTTNAGLQGDLAGTLEGTLAQGTPAVLIVPGSGPTDRDGNSPLGIAAQTYKLLAEALAQRGIASVRIDKRGMFGSAAAVPDPNAVTVDDYVADIESWADTISQASGGQCVWLLGHSEGGLMGMAAAAKDPSRYCGLLLVASVARNLGDVLRAQLAANPANAPILPEIDAIIAKLKAGESVPAAGMHPALVPLFAPQVQGFLGSVFRQEPAELIAAHDLPVLILNGTADLQTPAADARALASVRPDATLVILERVNHVLKQVPDDTRAANLATYAAPDLPLAPGVVDAIVEVVTGSDAS